MPGSVVLDTVEALGMEEEVSDSVDMVPDSIDKVPDSVEPDSIDMVPDSVEPDSSSGKFKLNPIKRRRTYTFSNERRTC